MGEMDSDLLVQTFSRVRGKVYTLEVLRRECVVLTGFVYDAQIAQQFFLGIRQSFVHPANDQIVNRRRVLHRRIVEKLSVVDTVHVHWLRPLILD